MLPDERGRLLDGAHQQLVELDPVDDAALVGASESSRLDPCVREAPLAVVTEQEHDSEYGHLSSLVAGEQPQRIQVAPVQFPDGLERFGSCSEILSSSGLPCPHAEPLEELSRPNSEGLRKANDIHEGKIALAPLRAANVRGTYSRQGSAHDHASEGSLVSDTYPLLTHIHVIACEAKTLIGSEKLIDLVLKRLLLSNRQVAQ